MYALRVALLVALAMSPAVLGVSMVKTADNLRDADEAFFQASIADKQVDPSKVDNASPELSLLQTGAGKKQEPSVSVSLVGELSESKAKAKSQAELEIENRKKDVELENAAIAAREARKSDNELESMVSSLVGKYHGGLTAEERVRNQDLEIADALSSAVAKHAGARDLGAGAVGGNLVKTLLGNSIKLSDKGWQTVFNHAKARAYNKFWRTSLVSKNEKKSDKKEEARVDARPASKSFLIPFLRFYRASTKDHIGTTDPYEFSNKLGDYSFQGIVAFIWSRQDRTGGIPDPDQIPLYRYWDRNHQSNNHFFSTNPKLHNGNSIIRQGIAGFVYNNTKPGLVPLNEFRGDGDAMYSISSASQLSFNGVSYKKIGRICFVHPLVQAKSKLPKILTQHKKKAASSSSGSGSGSGSHDAKGPAKEGPKWYPGQAQWEDLSG
eukprot:TRINITY_DN24180_c0_g1_i1.p1 TRINITY_DN24180_c0_g1~~TRINITY_DN24180_c0_g1_i1.p1  ORF type:complete len:438 (+),score=161.49 TRINITY_DN24180_c0_g1_i1:232-1545(+)